MIKAYAFEWPSDINPPYAGSAVVAAGNISSARSILAEELKGKGLKPETAAKAWSTKPGPYWTSMVKGMTEAKLLFFNEG